MDPLYWVAFGALVGCNVILTFVSRRLLRIVASQDSDMTQVLATAQVVADQNARLVTILQQVGQPLPPMEGPVQ